MGRVWHSIYSNSGAEKCGTRPENGINIGAHGVNSYSYTPAPVKSVTQVVFWWWVYVTTFRTRSKWGKYAMWPIAQATGRVSPSVRSYKVPSEPSEPSRTPRCFWRRLVLLLMSGPYFATCHLFLDFSDQIVRDDNLSVHVWGSYGLCEYLRQQIKLIDDQRTLYCLAWYFQVRKQNPY